MSETMHGARPLRLGPQGRVVIPSDMRAVLGVEPGDDLVAWIEGDRLVFRSRKAIREELWAMFGHVETSLADELIRDRRAEAIREAAEDRNGRP